MQPLKRLVCAQANFVWAHAALGEELSSACVEAVIAQAHLQQGGVQQNWAIIIWSLCVLQVGLRFAPLCFV